jgi:hypothetical protein
VLTGCPVVVNTSFNIRGEPIVGTPEDAFRRFMGTELDILMVGNCVLRKGEQNPALKQDYRTAFKRVARARQARSTRSSTSDQRSRAWRRVKWASSMARAR